MVTHHPFLLRSGWINKFLHGGRSIMYYRKLTPWSSALWVTWKNRIVIATFTAADSMTTTGSGLVLLRPFGACVWATANWHFVWNCNFWMIFKHLGAFRTSLGLITGQFCWKHWIWPAKLRMDIIAHAFFATSNRTLMSKGVARCAIISIRNGI